MDKDDNGNFRLERVKIRVTIGIYVSSGHRRRVGLHVVNIFILYLHDFFMTISYEVAGVNFLHFTVYLLE